MAAGVLGCLARRARPEAALPPPAPCRHAGRLSGGARQPAHRRDIEDAYLRHIEAARARSSSPAPTSFPDAHSPRAVRGRPTRRPGAAPAPGPRGVFLPALRHARPLWQAARRRRRDLTSTTRASCTPRSPVFDRARRLRRLLNIDPFSLLLAREANVFSSDTGFAASCTTAWRRRCARAPSACRRFNGIANRYGGEPGSGLFTGARPVPRQPPRL